MYERRNQNKFPLGKSSTMHILDVDDEKNGGLVLTIRHSFVYRYLKKLLFVFGKQLHYMENWMGLLPAGIMVRIISKFILPYFGQRQ